MLTILALFATAVVCLALQLWMLRFHRRRLTPRRRVELPNSHYVPVAVARRAILERWAQLRDDPSIHPLNREEVSRLLAIAEASGPEALPPRARQFLDALERIRQR